MIIKWLHKLILSGNEIRHANQPSYNKNWSHRSTHFGMKILLAFLASAAMSLTARSDIVWSWQTTLESHTAGASTQAQLWFGNYGGVYNLFDSVGISAADVGHTFRLTSSADESDFLAAVLSLTDG